jgi:hypothetical protein
MQKSMKPPPACGCVCAAREPFRPGRSFLKGAAHAVLLVAAVIGLSVGIGQCSAARADDAAMDRMLTNPDWQTGCAKGRLGMLPPAVPPRFTRAAELTELTAAMHGYAYCKAMPHYPKASPGMSEDDLAKASAAALAHFQRLNGLLIEVADRQAAKPAKGK